MIYTFLDLQDPVCVCPRHGDNLNVHLDLSGEQAAALARAATEDEVRQLIGGALADYFNGGSAYGGFAADDFDFDPGYFDLR